MEAGQSDYDFLRCLEVVKACREVVAEIKTEANFEQFCMERFRSSIDGPIRQDSNGNNIFRMKWKVGSGVHGESYEVCRKVFLYCYQITEHQVKEISRKLKVSEHGLLSPSETATRFDEKSNNGKLTIIAKSIE